MTEWSVEESPRRYWKTKEYNTMQCYLAMKGRVPLGELLDHFAEKYPHVNPRTVELNYATATWDEPPTDEDRENLAAKQACHAERHEKWERETYQRLKTKFAG